MLISSIFREIQTTMTAPVTTPAQDFQITLIALGVSLILGFAVLFALRLIVSASFRLGRLKRYVDRTSVKRSALRMKLNTVLNRMGVRNLLNEYYVTECRDNSHLHYPVRVLYLLWVRHYRFQRDACLEAAAYLYKRSEKHDSPPLVDQEIADVYFNENNNVTVTMVTEADYHEVVISGTVGQATQNDERVETAHVSEAITTPEDITVLEGDPTAEDL